MFPMKHVRSLNVLEGNQRVPKTTVTDKRNTVVTSGIQKCSVYPKSTRNEAHFLFTGSITITCSTTYRITVLISFRKIQRFRETPVSSLYEY